MGIGDKLETYALLGVGAYLLYTYLSKPTYIYQEAQGQQYCPTDWQSQAQATTNQYESNVWVSDLAFLGDRFRSFLGIK